MYLPYVSTDKQTVLGHYMVAQRSGEIAATLGAAAHLARIRWAPTLSNIYLVLLRLRVGWSVSADITSGKIEMPFRAIIARQFTVDYTAHMTSINMATTAKTNVMRSTGPNSMSPSQMGANGPGICDTAGGTGQTLTADAAPFAISTTAPLCLAVSATGTATLATQGMCSPMVTLYERGADGFHPVILANNEGVLVQNHLAGPASGTFGLYTEWTWAEVSVLP